METRNYFLFILLVTTVGGLGVHSAVFGGNCPGNGNCYLPNGTPGCNDESCCNIICAADPFCCNIEWDNVCAGNALEECGDCGDPGAGSCYGSNGTPGCNDQACCELICPDDPFCCNVSWDGVCADQAADACFPANDLCGNPITIFDGETPFATTNAGTDGAAHITCGFCCNDDQIHNDIWYLYTATCTGELTVSTCGDTDFDTKLAVYQNDTFPPGWICQGGGPTLELLGCNDDAGCPGLASQVTISVETGNQYRIRVGGFNGASGSGTLTVSCEPPDLCSEPLEIFQGDTDFSTIDATTDGAAHITCGFCCGDDQIHNDIWFIHEATCTGQMTVSTCNQADYDTKLAVYQNASGIGWICDNGGPAQQLLGCNDDTAGCALTSEVTVNVVAGNLYRIRVGGYNGDSGNGTLSVSCGPGGCTGDLNNSGTVDGSDLGLLLGNWGGSSVGDLNNDGEVDGSDLGLLLGNWGGC